MHHLIDRQIFNSNRAEAVDKFARFLVCEVSATASDTLMDTRDNFATFNPFGRPFFRFRKLALRSSQIFFVVSKKSWVVNVFASGERSKAFKPDINPNGVSIFRQDLRFNFARKTGKPFSRRGSVNGAGLNGALNRAMQRNSDVTNLGELQNPFNHPATARYLWECKRVIAMLSTKSRVAWVLASLNPTKECFKRQIDTDSNVLQDLGMNARERLSPLLELGYRYSLSMVIERFFLILPRGFSLLKKMVIQPTALIKSRLQQSLLFFGGSEAIFKRFKHVVYFSLNYV
jgi:hypothetical protein